MAKRWCGSIVVFVGISVVAGVLGAQNIINVPGNAATIQTAINLAQNGDTVLVAPGTYAANNMSFLGKAITVRSSSGPTVTTINAGSTGRHFIFNSNEGPNSVLEGFRLLNGRAPSGMVGAPSGESGGSIRIDNASPTIRRCTFDNCIAGTGGYFNSFSLISGNGGHGGGVFVAGNSSLILEDCRFIGCISGDSIVSSFGSVGLLGRGGAIYAAAPITMTGGEITGCRNGGYSISGAAATASGPPGGGVFATAPVTFRGVTFSGNRTFSNGGHGGALAATGPVTIDRCVFLNNRAADGAFSSTGGYFSAGSGGACHFNGGPVTVQRTRFEGNSAGESGLAAGSGGAIRCIAGTLTIEDSTFIGNSAGDAIVAGVTSTSAGNGGAVMTSSGATIRRTTFSGNRAGHAQDFGVAPGNGGALFLSAATWIEGCIFDRNSGGDDPFDATAGRGGAVASTAAATLIACALSGNLSGTSSSGVDIEGAVTGMATISHSVVWQNGVTPLSSSVVVNETDCDVPVPGIGNISVDPRFIDAASGNLRIAWDSPCIDIGSPLPPTTQGFDVDGEPRPQGVAVDLGADEVLRAGTADDIELTSVGPNAASPANATQTPSVGDAFSFVIRSPGHAFDGETVIVVVEGFSAAMPPAGPIGLPFIYVSPTPSNGFWIVEPALPSNGLSYPFTVPAGLSGLVARLQAFLLTPSASNGYLVATAAHDVVWP